MFNATIPGCLFLVLFTALGCGEPKIEVASYKSETNSTLTDKKLVSAELEKPTAAIRYLELNYLTGRFEPAQHPDFTAIAPPYATENGMLMRKDAYNDFKRMADAARKEGVSLRIISATRNFDRQRQIWEGKWNGSRLVEGKKLSLSLPDTFLRAAKILEFSSMPGTSRHHWGTDIDLNNLNNSYFDSGAGLKTYNWLVQNAATFGFAQPYSAKNSKRPHGYEEEKWHWSYLPISVPLTRMVETEFTDTAIHGFSGAGTAFKLQIREKYMLGIDSSCL